MKGGPSDVQALVLYDQKEPIMVLLIPERSLTEELLALCEETAEEYDQFVRVTPTAMCKTRDECHARIRSLNGNHSTESPPGQ